MVDGPGRRKTGNADFLRKSGPWLDGLGRLRTTRRGITLLGGAAAWPLAAWAHQAARVRRIGVLMWGDENDPVAKTYVSAFTQALAGLGWTDGRNVRMNLRRR